MTPQPEDRRAYVTVEIGEHLFGVPIGRVREVFSPGRMTRVPLAPAEIAGVLNLRGRIVTAIDMRLKLGMKPAAAGAKIMALGVDHRQEAYALLVDRPGDVVEFDHVGRERPPSTLDARWAELVDCVHRFEDRLLLVLDVDRALAQGDAVIAA